MSNKVLPLLAVFAMLTWAPKSEVDAEYRTDCESGTLIYWHEHHAWICEPRVTAGPACTLCHGEPIDVVG